MRGDPDRHPHEALRAPEGTGWAGTLTLALGIAAQAALWGQTFFAFCRDLCRVLGMDSPLSIPPRALAMQVARFSCPAWYRRQLGKRETGVEGRSAVDSKPDGSAGGGPRVGDSDADDAKDDADDDVRLRRRAVGGPRDSRVTGSGPAQAAGGDGASLFAGLAAEGELAGAVEKGRGQRRRRVLELEDEIEQLRRAIADSERRARENVDDADAVVG
jgi:hypothetical protein